MEPGTSSQSASGEPSIAPQPNKTARVGSILHDILSLSAEERSEILRLMQSPSNADPSSATPPTPGLPSSASTPETAARLSTTDPALPPTPSAIPEPSPQTPAPLHATPVCDASSIPSEGEEMSLPWLEKLLGVTEEDVKNGAVVPEAGWKQLKTKVTEDGFTLLMRAAREGALDCVEFLLRCGDDVNARTKQSCGAIDYAFEGDHSKVALLLFRWDSRLPKRRSYERNMFQALLEQDEQVRKLFEERDLFRDELMKENLAIVEKMIDTFNGLRYCVSSEGHSALYTAGYDFKFHAWALLKTRGFQYLAEERSEMEDIESNENNTLIFGRALGNYFVDIDECHVVKMMLKTKVRGGKSHIRDIIREIYEEMNQVPMASLLLQCLQDDCYLEVVLDMEKSDVSCICAGVPSGVLGVMDPKLHRVYASAGETKEFDHSDVISNMVHELAHRAMLIVFENEGLPYKKEDAERMEEYEKIVSVLLSEGRLKDCDDIIQRVTAYPQSQHGEEVIVRVPEIISKYHVNKDVIDGYSRLQAQARELYEFYEKHVEPAIKSYIEKNRWRNKLLGCDLSKFLRLLSDNLNDSIDVKNKLKEAVISKHNGVEVFRVSNIKLGISHLRKSFRDLLCIDLGKYNEFEDYFKTLLKRGRSSKVAVILEGQLVGELCTKTSVCEFNCPAKRFKKYPGLISLVVPMDMKVPEGIHLNEYGWSDMSAKTMKWLLEKKVSFQGSEVTLGRLLVDVVGEGNAEGWMERNVTPGEISMLIDQGIVSIGRAVATPSNYREKALILGEHKECLIPRRLRVRPVKFDSDTLDSRKSDAFFIFGTEKKDLMETGIKEVQEWVSGRMPENAKFFFYPPSLLKAMPQEDTFRRVTEQMENIPGPGISGEAWKFSHFFSFEGKSFQHLYSQSVGTSRTLILADDPGNGKSLYVKAIAMNGKSTHPLKWIQVIELGHHEKEMEKWKEENEKNAPKEINLISREEIEDSVSRLISGRETEVTNLEEYGFENKIFKLSCQQSGKITILLDGLDEVCPYHREKVLYFLKSLIGNTQINVVVTTRVHECAGLERSLDTIAYHLEPFESGEQLRFLEMEWKAVLKSLPDEARDEKVQSIITNLVSSHDIEREKEISDFIEELKNVLNKNFNIGDVNFRSLAERLMEIGKASVEGERNFTATPLNTWMAAEVFLGENFNLSPSFTLGKIYEKFIDKKINLFYVTEKVGASERSVGKDLRENFKNGIYASLKEFAASFFLREAKCRVEKNDIQTLIRVGLVVERDGLNVFVHRTIGEYMLSIWIIDGKTELETMMKVLSEREFHQVRRFLEGQLPSFEKQGSSESGEGVEQRRISLMNPTKFPSNVDAIISFKKCLYLSIAEGNIGIMQNLMESSGEYVECVVYEKAGLEIRELNLSVDDSCDTTAWNAFTLFGEIILGNVTINNEGKTITSRIQCLSLLVNFLQLIDGKDNLIDRLEGVLTDQKLMWMGFGEEDLWKEEKGKRQFELLLKFLIGVKGSLGESVKKALMDEESKSLFNYAAEHSIKSFVPLLDAYLKKSDFDDCLLPSSQNTSLIKCNNVVCVWTTVVRRSGVEDLQLLWNWLRLKMETPEMMKRFLRRKDGKKRNVLFASCCNEKYPKVFEFVGKLYNEVFDERELKDDLFNTFSGVVSTYKFNKFAFFELMIELLSSGLLNEDEVGCLILSNDERGKYYLLDLYSLYSIPSPSLCSKVQRFIFERLRSKEEIVRNMSRHYETMTLPCLYSSWWMGEDVEFECEVESAFEAMRSSILSFPFFRDFQLDGEGNLVGVVNRLNEERMNVIQFKAFAVLLRRQVEMEEGILGREEAVKRLKGEWGEMFKYLPNLRIEGRETENKGTIELSVRFTFAVLSVILTKEEITEILLWSGGFYPNPFLYALCFNDPNAFFAMYDIVRWCMAEDALCTVHAFEWGGETVLEYLLWSQEEGLIKYNPQEDQPSENASPESRAAINLTSEDFERFKGEIGDILRRQVEKEEGMLGREEAVQRQKGKWWWQFYSFPRVCIEGRKDENRGTRGHLVRFNFAVLSEKLTKEEIAEILLWSDDETHNPFHYALHSSDPKAFLAMYDIARSCVAEDALWRVHAVEWRGRTLLESLLYSQENGVFENLQVRKMDIVAIFVVVVVLADLRSIVPAKKFIQRAAVCLRGKGERKVEDADEENRQRR